MRFQVTTSFNNIEVLIADYTVNKKKVNFKTLNVQYIGSVVAKVVRHCYEAPMIIATLKSDYGFKIGQTSYVIKLVK